MLSRSPARFALITRRLRAHRLVPVLLVADLVLLVFACPAAAHAELGVDVVRLEPRSHYAVERVYGGEIRARRSSTLGFRRAGELAAVYVDEGETVRAGSELARLDDRTQQAHLEQADARVAHAEASLAAARTELELARATLDRHQNLVERGHTSRQRYDEVRLDLETRRARLSVAEAELLRARADRRAAAAELAQTRLVAPYDARVQARLADEGAILVTGQATLKLVEEAAPEARIGLPVAMAATLEPGSRHTLIAGEQRLEGELRHLLPEVDARTRTVTALFSLPSDARPPAGSLVELELERRVPGDGYWLPLSALTEAQRGLWSVYALAPGEDGVSVTERRLVEIVHSEGDRAFVRGTLRPGEQVVRSGTHRIVPGQAVFPVGSGAAGS